MAVLGAAFGATFLPDFAASIAAQNFSAASEQWRRATLRLTLVLAPIAALLLALAVPLIAMLFQRGAFDATATYNSALVLAGLVLGLPLRGIGGLVVRGLPAFQTRRAPLVLSALASGTSIAFAFALLNVWGLFGVALAVSLGDALFALGGTVYFWRRMHTDERATLVALAKVFAVSVVAGGASYLCAQLLHSFPYVLQVFVGGGVGILLFSALAFLFRLPETGAVVEILRTSIGWKRTTKGGSAQVP
jgi:putative peptidoglycan lipid II flippase